MNVITPGWIVALAAGAQAAALPAADRQGRERTGDREQDGQTA